MTNHLQRLTEILPPPEAPEETTGDWLDAESKLGTPLPPDYKEFIEVYGSGGIVTQPGLDILWILNPFSANNAMNLIHRARGLSEHFRNRDSSDRRRPYEVFPVLGGLLMWGICIDGDMIFLRTQGEPHEWSIETDECRGDNHFVYPDKTFVTFLLALAERTLEGFSFGRGPCRFLTAKQVDEYWD